MKTKWEDKFSVKITELDNQHKDLFDLINELEDFSKKYDYKEILPSTLNTLTKYVETHFTTEEEYMEKVNYPFFEEHKIIHKEFESEVSKEIEKIKSNDISPKDIIFVHSYLAKWIKNHILIDDKKYVEYLKEFHDLE